MKLILDRTRHTWHQSLRASLQSNTDVVAFSILRPSPRAVVTWYTGFFLCFIQCALLHIIFDSGWRITSAESGALLFFTIQPVAFAIEVSAAWICDRYGILQGDGPFRVLLGYTWVVFWYVLACPVWIYPQLRNLVKRGADVPFLYLKVLG
ncbi:uncharacterized protein BDV17DRAFT_290233 [Aspergillus undulatus]|uniref:uncharacterized protein n=1 Tax=Aspergillus undulatus TaxID=1810928 RepID=UPI003CCDBD99